MNSERKQTEFSILPLKERAATVCSFPSINKLKLGKTLIENIQQQ